MSRYHFTGYLGGRRSAAFDEISDAAAMFDAFVAETQAAPWLHMSDGCCSIWDNVEGMTIANWRMPRPKLRPTNPFEIFSRLIASGQPVTIIDGGVALSFNERIGEAA